MKVYRDLSAKFTPYTVATIGIFDGVHLAHKQIIKRLSELAKNRATESMLITLWPHPRYVLNKDAEQLKLISTLDEKLYQLEKAGLDNVLLIPFDKTFASLPFHMFIKRILVDKLRVNYMVIGFNHHFGRDRQGDFTNLKQYAEQYGFGLEQMPKVEVNELGVSSSAIREHIHSGRIDLAGKMLGYDFQIVGKVVHGSKVGREFGFPTANIDVPEVYKIIPANGVYAVKAEIHGKEYEGMLNIGTRPTVDNRGLKTIEANFFNFNANIYDTAITITFFQRIREEIKFNTKEALIGQIHTDKSIIQDYFRRQLKK